MAAWDAAPVVQDGTPSVTPAWMKAPLAEAAPAEKPRSSETAEALLGPTELLGSGILRMAPAAAHAALDLYHRITGQQTPNADDSVNRLDTSLQPGAAGQQLEGDLGNAVNTAAQSLDTAAGGVPSRLVAAGRSALNANPTVKDVLNQTAGVAGDVANLVPAIGIGGKAVGAAGDFIDAARTAEPALRSAQDAPHIATTLAGSSGRAALTLRNQALANEGLAGEAGVPSGSPLTYDSLAQAREVPNAVYGRVASNLPTGPLSEKATQLVKSAGQADGTVVTGGPDAAATIQNLRDQLLAQPMSGEQAVQNMRKLRQEGFTNIAHDDPSNQQIGRAQIDMANALEQHVADSLPPGAGVDLDQLQQARTALAKNFAVQSALKGQHVDMQAIARMQRANPDLLTGFMKDAADFANAHPEVSSLPSPTMRYTGGPNLAEDVKNLNPVTRPIGSVLELLGGAAGRRMLTGDTAGAVQAIKGLNPTALRNAALAEKTPGSLADLLQPSLGNAFEPGQGDLFGGGPPQTPTGAPGAVQVPLGTAVGEGKASPTPASRPGPSDYGKNLGDVMANANSSSVTPTQKRILNAYTSLVPGGNGRATLADLRDRLPDVSPTDFDREIKSLASNGVGALMREDNNTNLVQNPRLKQAAVQFGNEPRHLFFATGRDLAKVSGPP